jgi:hypothetical protein
LAYGTKRIVPEFRRIFRAGIAITNEFISILANSPTSLAIRGFDSGM